MESNLKYAEIRIPERYLVIDKETLTRDISFLKRQLELISYREYESLMVAGAEGLGYLIEKTLAKSTMPNAVFCGSQNEVQNG